MSTVLRKNGEHLAACFPDEYDSQLKCKVERLKDLLDWKDRVEVFESPRTNFRMRANFQMWHDDAKNKVPSGFYYCMFEAGQNRQPYEIKTFPRGSVKINQLMKGIMDVIQYSTPLFKGLFEIRFLTTQLDEAVIILCYRTPLQDGWQAAADAAAEKLKVKIVGRARKVKAVAGGEETVLERLTVREKEYFFYQTEGAFSQPNACVCEQMITWAADVTENSHDFDLLELYCGGGTFTAPLASNFRKVLATEISKASVDLALKSFAKNSIENIKIARLSSEEFTSAYTGNITFKRLKDSGIDLKSYDIRTVLVDPPRAGLDDGTCALLSRFENIVYISCNPETLSRDVKKLRSTHTLQRVAAFDQFPYTHHLESGVFLVRKTTSREANGAAREEHTGAQLAAVPGANECATGGGRGGGREGGMKQEEVACMHNGVTTSTGSNSSSFSDNDANCSTAAVVAAAAPAAISTGAHDIIDVTGHKHRAGFEAVDSTVGGDASTALNKKPRH